MTSCAGCGKPVKPRPNGGPPKLYCTKACGNRTRERDRAKRAKVIGDVKILQPSTAFPAAAYRASLRAWFDPLEAVDAIHECPHGRLPGYTGDACDCWKTAEATA